MLYIFFHKRRRVLLLIILILLITIFSHSYFDESVFNYVKNQSQQAFEKSINSVLEQEITSASYSDFIKLKYDDGGKISYAYMDTVKAMSLKSLVSSRVSDIYSRLKKDLDFVDIPIGYFFTKKYFFTDGITLPVKIKTYDSIKSEVKTNIKGIEINSKIYEIYLDINMSVIIHIPFQTKNVELSSSLLLSSGLINSEIPKYYFYGDKTPVITNNDNN